MRLSLVVTIHLMLSLLLPSGALAQTADGFYQMPGGIPFVVQIPRPNYRPYLYHLDFNLSANYQVVVIESDRREGATVDSEEGKRILRLARRGKKAFLDSARAVIKKKFPGEYSEKDIAKMSDSDYLYALHTSRILVFEGGKPLEKAKLLAGMRVVADGGNGAGLELEQSIPGYVYPRNWRFAIHYLNDADGTGWTAATPILEGGSLQLTGFFNNGPSEIGAVLNFVASKISLHREESMPIVALNKQMKETYRELTKGQIATPDFVRLWPSEVVAYCDQELAEHYYLPIMKFKNVNRNGGPVDGRTYVVRSSMGNFDGVAKQNFLYRSGSKAIEENGLTRKNIETENGAKDDIHYRVSGGWINPDKGWYSPSTPWTLPAPPRIYPSISQSLNHLVASKSCRALFEVNPQPPVRALSVALPK